MKSVCNTPFKLAGIVGFIICILTATIQGQDTKFTALMIINLAKNIDWPDASGPFIITVLGDDPIYDELVNLAAKAPLSGRSMDIKKATSLNTVGQSQILYLSPDVSSLLSSALTKWSSNHTLIVTNKAGLGKEGAAINFKMVDGRLRFEINVSTLKKCALTPKSVLFKLGSTIE